MYLFVYVFLLLSVMGLYTQLFVLSTTRMAENQKGVAEIMLVWHGAAYKKAKSNVDTDCFLTNDWVPACTNLLVDADLPGYQFGNTSFRFRSYIYTIGGSRHVMTYVPAAPNTLGYTAQQILAQMRNTDFPRISYGGVATTSCNGAAAAHQLVTSEVGTGNQQICYPLPAAIPDGAVGIISILGS